MSSIKCFFVEYVNELSTETESVWRRVDTGETFSSLGDVPVGGMWYAHWFGNAWNPQLGAGKNLIVKTPGGDWMVDSQCSNCTMPEDRNQEEHHCWVIHGTPPNITVGKDGVTCGAGAGSFMPANGSWHGFLKGGFLTE